MSLWGLFLSISTRTKKPIFTSPNTSRVLWHLSHSIPISGPRWSGRLNSRNWPLRKISSVSCCSKRLFKMKCWPSNSKREMICCILFSSTTWRGLTTTTAWLIEWMLRFKRTARDDCKNSCYSLRRDKATRKPRLGFMTNSRRSKVSLRKLGKGMSNFVSLANSKTVKCLFTCTLSAKDSWPSNPRNFSMTRTSISWNNKCLTNSFPLSNLSKKLNWFS